MSRQGAATLLPALAHRALTTEAVMLSAPEWPRVPDCLRRADGESLGVAAAYRERYGHTHPADPIGPAPGRASPEARAAWHGALAALSRVDGIDLRGATDGKLWLRRGTYERETAWAPPQVAEQLRLMRVAQRDAHVKSVRAGHEARAASDGEVAGRHRRLARVWRALEAKAAREADLLAAVQETRRQWEAVTESPRRIAVAADVELRRRPPGREIPPLRPHLTEAAGIAWPEAPAPGADMKVWVQLTLDGPAHLLPGPTPHQQQNELAPSRQREAAGQLMLGLTPEAAHEDIPEQVLRIRDNAKIAQAKPDELAKPPARDRGRRPVTGAGLASPSQAGTSSGPAAT